MSRFNTAFLVAVLVAAVSAGAMAYPSLIINEIDYDQPGTADGGEFIELKNVSYAAVNLKDYSLELVDGTNPPGEVYLTLTLDKVDVNVPPGGYYVLCGSTDITTLTAEQCDRNAPSNLVRFRNGARDGVRLLKGTEIVDMLSYGGMFLEGLTEGTTAAPKDLESKDNYSISRVPDGQDYDDNGTDFKWTCASPRRANYTAEECLCINTVCTAGKVCNIWTGLCEVAEVPEDVIEDTASPDTSTGEDVSEPPDTTVQDTLTGDSTSADSMADTTVPTDNTVHVDNGWEDNGSINPIFDLPGYQDEDLNGNKSSGCSAGRNPATGWAGLLLLLLVCMSFVAFRLRRTSA